MKMDEVRQSSEAKSPPRQLETSCMDKARVVEALGCVCHYEMGSLHYRWLLLNMLWE